MKPKAVQVAVDGARRNANKAAEGILRQCFGTEQRRITADKASGTKMLEKVAGFAGSQTREGIGDCGIDHAVGVTFDCLSPCVATICNCAAAGVVVAW